MYLKNKGAEEMTYSVKYLPCKYEELNLDPQYPSISHKTQM